jgi:hypothetical protein
MNKAYKIDGCNIVVSDGNKVTFDGLLMRTKQLEELEIALNEILANIDTSQHLTLDFIECEECISMLLKPVLIWTKEIVTQCKELTISVATEEEELLPWHETIVDRVEYFNSAKIPITIATTEL